jgi:hypothetical protein
LILALRDLRHWPDIHCLPDNQLPRSELWMQCCYRQNHRRRAQRIAELDQQRSALQSRISMIEAQGVDTGAQGLAAAKADLGPDIHCLPDNQLPRSELWMQCCYRQNHRRRQLPPPEINAITTYTAISDYTGGTMKAMITHDVYDATNLSAG